MSASTALTWPVLTYLQRRDVQLAPWLAALGTDDSQLLPLDSRMPLRALHGLWRAARHRCGDPALGVRIALEVDPLASISWTMPLSLFEHLGFASPSLREALHRQRRYLRLLRDGFTLGLENFPNARQLARFDYTDLSKEPPELIEFQMAMGVVLSRRITGNPSLTPQEIWFTHDAPSDLTPYISMFGQPPRFGAPCNAMLLSESAIDAPLPSHDPVLLGVCSYRANKLLAELPAIDDFRVSVRERIEAELQSGSTTSIAVAGSLGVSTRTLHRRLRAQGTTYQRQLDEVRLRLATGYLISRRYQLAEIASLLGFAHQSAFQRRFKAWVGETPAQYQERLRARARPQNDYTTMSKMYP